METSYLDTFVADNFPVPPFLPERASFGAPPISYPADLNCAATLLDDAVAEGNAEPVLFYTVARRVTYRQTLETANQIAHVLRDELGLQPGNRVLLRGPNTPELAACWLAVLKAGGICVTTMPLLRAKELVEIAEKAQIDIALCDGRWRDDLLAACAATTFLRTVRCFHSQDDRDLLHIAGRKPTQFTNWSTKAEDVAIIAFTSGTTGKGKATLHTHRDILTVCDCFPPWALRATPQDIFCGTSPIGFGYGLGGLLLFPLRARASVVLLEQASPAELLRAITQFRATLCFASPVAYRAMLELLPTADISSLRQCVSSGEHLSLACYEQWYAATNHKIIDGMGSTEMLHIFIAAFGDAIRPGATGKPVPGYEARIVDPDGRSLPPNTVGLLAVRGPTGCRYLADPIQQQAYVQNGWNITGDLYRVDDDGYFWYQSRADEMIISSGYNIAPIEVEETLLRHPLVRECAVVGYPDPRRGSIVKAYVVLQDSARPDAALTKELQDFVKATIAPYKYPRAIEFVAVLPRTATGKLHRRRLRTWGTEPLE